MPVGQGMLGGGADLGGELGRHALVGIDLDDPFAMAGGDAGVAAEQQCAIARRSAQVSAAAKELVVAIVGSEVSGYHVAQTKATEEKSGQLLLDRGVQLRHGAADEGG